MDQSDLDLIQSAPAYHLQSVIKTRHVPLSPLTPGGGPAPGMLTSSAFSPETVLEIAHYLFDAAALAPTLATLDEVEAAILRELVACGGRANSRDLALYFSCAGLLTPGKKSEAPPAAQEPPKLAQSMVGMPLQPPQYPPAHPHGVFEQSLRRLLLLGLLFWGKQTNFAGRDYTSGIHDGVLIVPRAVREAVRQFWPEIPEPLNDAGPGEREHAFQRSLYLYWSLVASQREGLPLVSNGLLARSAVRLVAEQLGEVPSGEHIRLESDFPRLFFIRFMLMKLGLLQERRNALYAISAEAFFARPLLERARQCYRLYLETPFWDELLYLPEVNVRPGPALLDPAHPEVINSRQLVIDRLLHEQVDAWFDITAFVARTKLFVPYLLFPRQYGPRAERYSGSCNPYGWDFRLRRGWLTHREGWHMVEGGFIRAIIGGPLAWLGLVELDRAENPTAFQLSSTALLSMRETAAPMREEEWGRLIVQPNFELVALAPVSEALLVNLDRFADRVSIEHIAQYRITRTSVTRAIQRGLQTETILHLLERAAGGEIPQNVRYSLVEWERQARRVELWQNETLLEVDDETLLDTLLADDETRALFGRRLAPRLIEVAPQRLQAVQELFWQRSYLPALTTAPTQENLVDDPSTLREPQWRLHDDGLLQPFYAVPDLYLAAEIEHFCERDSATTWFRITASSLRRALEQGFTLPSIIHFLQHACEGGVPASLLVRLKLWGGGYEAGNTLHIEQAPLLRISSEALADLRADSELCDLLGDEIEQSSRLVRLAPEHLDRLRALLGDRGFSIE